MQCYNLILEVTRNCNLRCPHCLRGMPRRARMSREIMTAAVTAFDYLGSVTFTGGEPSLGVEVIEDFIDLCRWRNIRFGYFYIVTNGHWHNRSRRLLNACDAMYERADEQDMCSLEVSRDQFHDYNQRLLWKFQNEYGEFPPYFHSENRTENIQYVIDEGMAYLNGIGSKERPEQKPWDIDQFGNVTGEGGEVYVAANGNVVCCDMSYARMDAEAKGNILQTPLSQIIDSYCVREQQEEAA